MTHNLAVLEEPNESEQRKHNNEVLRTIIGLLNDFFPTEGSYSIMELAIAASQVSFDSAGNLSSDNVQDALEELDDEKQETLVSGANIKTINSESILGSGNISITAGISEAPIDGNTYGRKDGAWAQVSVSGGGGANITIDTYANRPASPSDGDIFLPTNSLYAQVYDTSAWKSWGPVWKMTPFVSGDFSWLNNGSSTCTITTTNGFTYMTVPAGSTKIRALIKSKSTPYTVTVGFIPHIYSTASIGLLLYDSVTGKCVEFYFTNTGTCGISKWTAPDGSSDGTYSLTSGVYNPISLLCNSLVVWMRIADDGTDLTFSISYNGINWIEVYSVSRTDYCEPDSIGFYINTNSSTYNQHASILSWEES